MKPLRVFPILALMSMLLAACAGQPPLETAVPTPLKTQPVSPVPPIIPTEPTGIPATPAAWPEAALAAREALAEKLDLKAEDVTLVGYEPVEWPDSCMGVTRRGEMCMQVITPGYKVYLQAKGISYEAHTNQSGTQIIFIDGMEVKSPTGLAARVMLAQQLGVSPADVRVVSSAPVNWPDSCMGVQLEGQVCAQVITPGFRILLEAQGKLYEVHTDQSGAAVVLSTTTTIESGSIILTWQSSAQPCRSVETSTQGAAYGACGEPLQPAAFFAERRALQLADLQNRYRSFEAQTASGSVKFTGLGDLKASPSIQRAVAEWAQLVLMEAEGGRGGAAWGLAFAWHREGGIAGFCDDLGVYRSGEIILSSCKQAQADNRILWLDAGRQDQLFRWLDALANQEIIQTDQATADSMRINLVLSGSGQGKANAALQQEILRFAGQVYADFQAKP